MFNVFLVALGGALGSAARYLTMIWVDRHVTAEHPFGTLAVNVIGAVLMGLLAGGLAKLLPENQQALRLFIGVGMLGGFTTFSTFSLDMWTYVQRGEALIAGVYAIASVTLCLVGLMAGLFLMRAVG